MVAPFKPLLYMHIFQETSTVADFPMAFQKAFSINCVSPSFSCTSLLHTARCLILLLFPLHFFITPYSISPSLGEPFLLSGSLIATYLCSYLDWNTHTESLKPNIHREQNPYDTCLLCVCGGELLYSRWFSRSIHLHGKFRILFLSIVEQYSIVYMYCFFTINQFMDI